VLVFFAIVCAYSKFWIWEKRSSERSRTRQMRLLTWSLVLFILRGILSIISLSILNTYTL